MAEKKYKPKQCDACGDWFDPTAWSAKYCHKKACKELQKEIRRIHNRKYMAENRERFRESLRKYREENREKVKERKREYYEKNREKIKEQAREYYEKNREKVKEHKRESYSNKKASESFFKSLAMAGAIREIVDSQNH